MRRSSKVPLEPVQHGGGHERGLRSGTLNVPGIVGFGETCRLARARLASDGRTLAALRDRLWQRLQDGLPDVHLRGAASPRLPHNLNVGFDGVSGRDLVMALPDVAVSPGAACASTSAAASHVLLALGLSEAEARSSLRFGLRRPRWMTWPSASSRWCPRSAVSALRCGKIDHRPETGNWESGSEPGSVVPLSRPKP